MKRTRNRPLKKRGEGTYQSVRFRKFNLFNSAWLRKTENGTSRLSRWVWVIGFFLLAANVQLSCQDAILILLDDLVYRSWSRSGLVPIT